MEKKLRDEWCAALRSGKYVQGTKGVLRHGNEGPDEYCCIGVLADVIDPKGWGITEDPEIPIHWCGCIEYLPPGKNGDVIFTNRPDDTKTIQRKLATMNDSGDHNFNQIAGWIEENIEVTP